MWSWQRAHVTFARVRDIRSVLVADLKFSLHFSFEEPESGHAFTFATDEKKIDLKGWGTMGNPLVLRRFAPRVPRELIVVAGATALVTAFGLASTVHVVGDVPGSAPLPPHRLHSTATRSGTLTFTPV